MRAEHDVAEFETESGITVEVTVEVTVDEHQGVPVVRIYTHTADLTEATDLAPGAAEALGRLLAGLAPGEAARLGRMLTTAALEETANSPEASSTEADARPERTE